MDYKGMTIEEMRQRKKEMDYSCEELAEWSGVSADVVQQILEGDAESADNAVLKWLEETFAGRPAKVIREAQAPYLEKKRQGEFTVEDYYALPDTRRVELIDGVIYDMASPTSIHQAIGGEVFTQLREYIKKNSGMCIPLYSPIDVQLDCDNKTMVQRDMVIVCNRDKLRKKNVFGAPDFVVEILSRSTRKKDTVKKLQKYESAGVREYWVVDPDKKKVIVYEFGNEMSSAIYGFEDKVPVGILDGACTVDFAEIYEYVRFLYEEKMA